MKTDVGISIAGVRMALVSGEPDLKLRLEDEMRQFETPATQADIRITARWRDLSRIEPGKNVFDSGGVWQLFEEEDKYWFHCKAPAYGSTPYKVAWFDRDFRHGEVWLHGRFFDSGQPVYPLEYPLDELLLVQLLSSGRGVEIHAAGIVDVNGDGHLFSGQSGAGKTTISRLWHYEPGVTILSDDRIILRKVDGRYRMYGTPWHGEAEFSDPAGAPLRHIYFIRHGLENARVRTTGAEAATHLFARAFPPFYSAAGLAFTLAFCDEAVAAVPCYDLSVLPDRTIIDFLMGR
jgi:hypothetical protein